MDPITKDIQKIITENLPVQVGEALQARLADADRYEADLTEMRKNYDNILIELKSVRESNEKLLKKNTELIEKEESLEQREKAVLEKENQIEVTAARAAAAVANAKFQAIQETVSLVFKNGTVRRVVHERNEEVGDWNNSKNRTEWRTTGVNKTEEVTEE